MIVSRKKSGFPRGNVVYSRGDAAYLSFYCDGYTRGAHERWRFVTFYPHVRDNDAEYTVPVGHWVKPGIHVTWVANASRYTADDSDTLIPINTNAVRQDLVGIEFVSHDERHTSRPDEIDAAIEALDWDSPTYASDIARMLAENPIPERSYERPGFRTRINLQCPRCGLRRIWSTSPNEVLTRAYLTAGSGEIALRIFG